MMEEERPNPDDLLEALKLEDRSRDRGRLKLFFGYAAGVGKTFTMLEVARAQKAAGVDVVIGFVQPHGRVDTEQLMDGIEIIPTRKFEYRGIILEEFDLDAALSRRPQLILVDELAHTNVPESRHPKRWMDIDELVDSGIDVYTTMNVQHLETLNDVVAQITGIVVKETVPDAVLEKADEIELIDLPPDDLLERLRLGKVYLPKQAERALGLFFKKPNLIALRELALRKTAERINMQVQSARRGAGSQLTWQTTERLLVCVGPSANSGKVIRSAKRLASALQAEWIVAHVETPQSQRINESARHQLSENLHLAEQLGAEVTTLSGHNRAEEIVKYAHTRNVTKIVVGKSSRSYWYRMIRGSVADELQMKSGEIDVYVIPGDAKVPIAKPNEIVTEETEHKGYKRSALIVLLCTGVAETMHLTELAEANKVMVYLLGVVFVAARYGRGPGIFASITSVLLFDLLMVKPYFSFAVHDTQYLLMFGVMLGIAILISTLTARITQQSEMLRQRMQRTEALYRLSRLLASTSGFHQLIATSEKELADMFQADIIIYVSRSTNEFVPVTTHPTFYSENFIETGVARWVFNHEQIAGFGTDTLPQAKAIYLPLTGTKGTIGVLGVSPKEKNPLMPDQRQLLETFAGQIALAIEREQYADQTQQMLLDVEAERMRNALLSSISHDFRTPLAVITGAGTTLLEDGAHLDANNAKELLTTLVEEARRLNRYVDNLLEITRLASGSVKPDKQWNVIEDVIGSALQNFATETNREIQLEIPDSIPAISMDSVLIERVLINLLDNANQHTPPGSPIEIFVHDGIEEMQIEVADHGQGIPAGEEERIFEKFYRTDSDRSHRSRGTGLGLSICNSILKLHGGKIWVENRVGGGARFIFTIPRTT